VPFFSPDDQKLLQVDYTVRKQIQAGTWEIAMPGKMTFGYLFDFRNPPQWHRDWAEHYADLIEFAVWTEGQGFDAAWFPEHHIASDGYLPAPLTAAAAVAAKTSTMRLGTAVALAPLYHPVRFASDCAVLDCIAGGRLELTLAIGYRRRETQAFGVDFGKRGAMFDEFLEIVTRLWAGETVTFAGKFYQVKEARLMPAPPRGRIPLYIGGFVPKAMERVAKWADGYFGNIEAAPLYLEKWAAAGKDLASAQMRLPELFTVVTDNKAQAWEELAPHFHHVNNTYGEMAAEDMALGVSDERSLGAMSLDMFKAAGIMRVLSPGEAIDLFRGMAARAPVDHIMLGIPPGLPSERFKPYAELFAREVIPAFG
jgi:alkanesulfonate monooxygenase SsuD/methylene tetrahydromethanopterin reductase-like flavin-dependent oxidoreductase (luciferase family)